MRQEYYRVFEDLHHIYRDIYGRLPRVGLFPFQYRFPRNFDEKTALRLALEAVDSAIQKLGITLRPDARHFLLVSLHQMVTLPIAHRQSTARFSPRELQAILTDDVLKILQHAAQMMHQHEAITSSQILRATSNLLDGLGLDRLEIWG